MADGDHPQTRSKTALRTALWLAAFVVLAFTLRTVFNADVGFDAASQRNLFTGNDPYYDWRSITYTLHTGTNLNYDLAINYPEGHWNPNPPLFDWTTAPVAGMLQKFAPTVPDPVGTALNVMVAVWAALTVLPVYMIGHDLFGRKAGLWAAFFMAVSAPHIQRTSWGYPRHEAIALFFIVLAFAFLVRAFKRLDSREFVSSWRSGAAIGKGLKAAVAHNRDPLVYGLLAGVALTACADTWKGYPYALAALAIGLGFQLLVDHLRNRDSTAVFLVYIATTAVATFLPWALVYQFFPTFLVTTVYPSLYVLAGMAAVGIILVPTRDLPSILVFPALLLSGVVALVLLLVVFPATGHTIFSGLGYFNQSKLYGTIAEAQRPRLGEVAANFGFFSFLAAFWGVGRIIKGAYKAEAASMLMAAWSAVALFMTFAASRFLMNAAPVMSILIAYAVTRILARIGASDIKRRFRAAHGTPFASRSLKSLSWKPVAGVLLVAVFLVLPNAWIGVDAGMNSEFEGRNHLVDYQRGPPCDANGNNCQGPYVNTPRFGAFGIDFELKNNGWLPSMEYLAQQDTCKPGHDACTPGGPDSQGIDAKPALIAWWDYGHWVTGIGDHPTVADPFQSHYELAGRFLASDSEAEAMSWLTLGLLDGDFFSGFGHLSPPVQDYLKGTYPNLLNITWGYGYQAQYAVFHGNVTGTQVFRLYDKVCELTGKCVGYMGVDSRMFPYDNPNTNGIERQSIFYAPVFLANKNPDDYVPVLFRSGSTVLTMHRYGVDAHGNSYELPKSTYTDLQGNPWVDYQGYAYPLGRTPLQGYPTSSGIALTNTEAMQVTPKFQTTMFAKAFGGLTDTVPAGEGLEHWRVVQQSLEDSSQPGVHLRNVALLEYYRGAQVSGTLQDDAGNPLGSQFVAFQDGYGANHGTVFVAPDGHFTLTAPFAQHNDLKLVVVAQDGSVLFSDNRTEFQFTKAQADSGATVSGLNLTVARGNVIGHAFVDRDGDGVFGANDTALGGARLSLSGQNNVTTDPTSGTYAMANLAIGRYTLTASLAGYADGQKTVVVKAGQTQTVDVPLALKPSEVHATFLDHNGTPLPDMPVAVKGGTTPPVSTNATGVATLSLTQGTYDLVVDTNVTVGGQVVRYLGHATVSVPFGGDPVEATIQRE